MDADNFSIKYIFEFDSNDSLEFAVNINRKTLISVAPTESKESKWTLLDFNKCEHCPFTQDKVKNCPIAFNISGVAENFAKRLSTEEINVRVITEEREYYKRETVQHGLRSILGIYTATSGCPHMDILKPMARFHLPFATVEETMYRYVTSYLLSQYFEYNKGNKPDFDLDGLLEKSDNVDKVSYGISTRIEEITVGDANNNAIVILNAIGLMLKIEIDNKLDSLRYLFK